MKKYLFGLFAIALAVSFTAFTTAKSAKRANVTLVYVGASFTQANVQNPANWQEITVPTCGTAGAKACTLIIDDSYLNSNSPRSIDASLLATVPTQGSGSTFKAKIEGPVTDVDDKQ